MKQLTRVKRAAEAKRRADEAFRAALLEARPEQSYADIARAAGTSRQRVRYLLTRRA